MYVGAVYAWLVPMEARRRHWSLGTEVVDGCKPSHGFWDQKPGLLS